jgi:hypothetical protein
MNYTAYLEYLDRPEPKTEPGEWQVDEHGKRFRMNGNVREYEEMIYLSTGACIPKSQLAEYNRKRKEQEEQERIKKIEEIKNAPKPRSCPLKNKQKCIREKCGLWAESKCSIAIIADSKYIKSSEDEATAKTKKCAFNPYNCDAECAFFNKGCAITRIAMSCNE